LTNFNIYVFIYLFYNNFQFYRNLVKVEKLTDVDTRPERKDNSGRDWTSMKRSQKIHRQGRSTSQPTELFAETLTEVGAISLTGVYCSVLGIEAGTITTTPLFIILMLADH
jgi:hypothetical protein